MVPGDPLESTCRHASLAVLADERRFSA
nr:unnamed protein product [synthetic construct]